MAALKQRRRVMLTEKGMDSKVRRKDMKEQNRRGDRDGERKDRDVGERGRIIS